MPPRRAEKILVRCSAGISRSPMVVAAYLMKRKGMTLKAALGQIICARPQVSPDAGSCAAVEGDGDGIVCGGPLARWEGCTNCRDGRRIGWRFSSRMRENLKLAVTTDCDSCVFKLDLFLDYGIADSEISLLPVRPSLSYGDLPRPSSILRILFPISSGCTPCIRPSPT